MESKTKRFHQNVLTMTGNLTKDCMFLSKKEELEAAVSFSLCCQEGDKTQFIQVRYRGEQAEALRTQLTKGSFVELSGRLKDFKGIIDQNGKQTYYKGIQANFVNVIKHKEST